MKKVFNDKMEIKIQPKQLKLMPISEVKFKQNNKELGLLMKHNKDFQHVSTDT